MVEGWKQLSREHVGLGARLWITGLSNAIKSNFRLSMPYTHHDSRDIGFVETFYNVVSHM
jgi:hypothetical protein